MSTGSPTPSLDSFSGTPAGSCIDSDPTRSMENSPPVSTTSSVLGGNGIACLTCPYCHDPFTNPIVLSCLHTVCHECSTKLYQVGEGVCCPQCAQFTDKPPNLLIPDYSVMSLQGTIGDGVCAFCRTRDINYRCIDCSKNLCQPCGSNHSMGFELHRIMNISEFENRKDRNDQPVRCIKHPAENIQFMCTSCSVAVCNDCVVLDHPSCTHNSLELRQVGRSFMDKFHSSLEIGRQRLHDMKACIKNAESTSARMSLQYEKARKALDESYKTNIVLIEQRKGELDQELEYNYSTKQMALSNFAEKAQNALETVTHICDFGERVKRYSSDTEILMHAKAVQSKLQEKLIQSLEVSFQNVSDIEFVPYVSQQDMKNALGYIRTVPEHQPKVAPIARPINSICSMNSLNNSLSGINFNSSVGLSNGVPSTRQQITALATQLGNNYQQQQQQQQQQQHHQSAYQNGGGLNIASTIAAALNSNGMGGNCLNSSSMANVHFQNILANKRFQNSGNGYPNGGTNLPISDLNSNSNYEKWSSGDAYNTDSMNFGFTPTESIVPDAKYLSLNTYPPRSQCKRQKMIYHCKFGEFGVLEGQFTEPSGVAVNAQNDIIVADTNNHRIQIFDKEGRFKFQFGECGKRDGQLLYPNRVAVVKNSGDIVVTERSPTHQIQIYNQYGQFVRKFGASTLCYPRGVTVDNIGRIVVIECKVMRVIIFDQFGNVGHQFNCPNHLEFPNGVVVNDHQEIFISDNRAHCVKVFNYDGVFLRQIGGEGITNYPIGVGITTAGEVLIADNHNNFNLTLFTQQGKQLNAYESKVKHAQCFDVALMDDGSVVLASKDYRLYVYRYLQPPPHM